MNTLPILFAAGVATMAMVSTSHAQNEPAMHSFGTEREAQFTDQDVAEMADYLREQNLVMQEGDMLCTQLEARVESLENLVGQQRALIAELEAELARQRGNGP